jgi:hypothetical protein
MRHFGAILTILALTSAPRPCAAQIAGGFGRGPVNRSSADWRRVGGNRLTGRSVDQSLEDQERGTRRPCGQAAAIKSNELGDDGDTIVTLSGATIKGKVAVGEFRIRSEFGTLTLKRSQLKSIHSFAGSGVWYERRDVF